MSVEFCRTCQMFHPGDECQFGIKFEGETEITELEFKARLIKAGWKPHEAEQEWQSIQDETESGE